MFSRKKTQLIILFDKKLCNVSLSIMVLCRIPKISVFCHVSMLSLGPVKIQSIFRSHKLLGYALVRIVTLTSGAFGVTGCGIP